MPDHIAIIMDGNGRWAARRKMPRIEGHRRGVKVVKEIVTCCAELKLKALTLYAFSSENWARPDREVSFLMRILKLFLAKERRTMMKNNIKFNCIGRMSELPGFVRKEIEKTLKATEKNKGMVLSLALNYGGRIELIDAVRKLLKDILKYKGTIEPLKAVELVDEDTFSNYLYTAGLPDPDLLIRTSGEMRISNFLLWQIAYTELYVTKVLWPDFKRENLYEALEEYWKRDRRFGGIK
ncbi:MAG: isoprenyl transferase [Candidatus Firestonebacteria bacterium]